MCAGVAFQARGYCELRSLNLETVDLGKAKAVIIPFLQKLTKLCELHVRFEL